MLPVCAAVRWETVHDDPLHVASICVSALAGVGPSATVELPPPTFNPPQPRTLRTAPPAPPDLTAPQAPPAGPVTKRSTLGSVVLVDVLVVELLDVLVVELLLVLVVVVTLLDVLVEDDVLVLVVVVLLVEVVVVDDVLVLVLDVLLVDVLVDDELLVLELVDVVELVEVVGGPLAQSVSELATAPSAMNWPGWSFLIVEASKRAQLRSVPVVMRTTTSPLVPASEMPVSLPTTFSTFVSFKTTTLTGTGPAGASLLMYL